MFCSLLLQKIKEEKLFKKCVATEQDEKINRNTNKVLIFVIASILLFD